MKIEIQIRQSPLQMESRVVPGCGAIARFEGIVRESENGECISALEYEAYQPMAGMVIQEILGKLGLQHPFGLARVHHRTGIVPVGEAAILLEVHSPHRGEAFAVLSEFMDLLKQDVPIWKLRALPAEPAAIKVFSPAAGTVPAQHPAGSSPIGIEELWHLIDSYVSLLSDEKILVPQAVGRRLSLDASAVSNFPSFDHSAMDGYAFAEAQPGKCRIVGPIAAGDSATGELHPGEAARILTGAMIPPGTFAVARQEDCSLEEGFVSLNFSTLLLPSSNIRRQAAIVRVGQTVVAAGQELLPGAVALLVACGVGSVSVHRQPRVTHLSTGSELLDAANEAVPGKIYDSNGPMMTALLASRGLAIRPRRLPDDLAALKDSVRRFDGDLLLISGGSGPGDRDNTPAALEAAGFKIHSQRVNSRPGRPLLFATRGSQVAFGLPGNPLSHWVCYHVFVRRVLDRLEGRPCAEFVETVCPTWSGPDGDGGHTWTPATVKITGGLAVAKALPWLHSGDLSPLSSANALLLNGPDPSTQRVQTLLL